MWRPFSAATFSRAVDTGSPRVLVKVWCVPLPAAIDRSEPPAAPIGDGAVPVAPAPTSAPELLGVWDVDLRGLVFLGNEVGRPNH